MSPVTVIIIIAVYFLLLTTISHFASRGSDNHTFFTGGRKTPWLIVAFATIGSAISGVTFISVPGMVASKGHGYLQMCLGFIIGYAIIAFVLVPLFYRKGLVSIYGYLGDRFGRRSYKSGAWIFFISKMLGASVRFFVVCAVLQVLVFRPLGIPFELNVIMTVGLIWLYTARGGVKSVIWTDLLKSACMIGSLILCIVFISRDLGFDFGETFSAITSHESSRVFYFDEPMSGQYFWKQFLAGIFMVISTTGLDQDMMQCNLACKDSKSAKKNMMLSILMQCVVIALFLAMGTLMLLFAEHNNMDLPEKSDELFGMVATHPLMPAIMGIVFIVGLIAAAYSAAGSALTSLTTSFTLDILDGRTRFDDAELGRKRRLVHLLMSTMMGLTIIIFYRLSEEDAISTVFTLASYTYGPILGLFAYGLLTNNSIGDRYVPAVCIAAPICAWLIQWSINQTTGYETGFELLILNALLTIGGLWLTSVVSKQNVNKKNTEYVQESI